MGYVAQQECPQLVTFSAATVPLTQCGHLGCRALRCMKHLRSGNWGTPLAEGLFQYPMTSGITPEGLLGCMVLSPSLAADTVRDWTPWARHTVARKAQP